jgi:hypothetical protein
MFKFTWHKMAAVGTQTRLDELRPAPHNAEKTADSLYTPHKRPAGYEEYLFWCV